MKHKLKDQITLNKANQSLKGFPKDLTIGKLYTVLNKLPKGIRIVNDSNEKTWQHFTWFE